MMIVGVEDRMMIRTTEHHLHATNLLEDLPGVGMADVEEDIATGGAEAGMAGREWDMVEVEEAVTADEAVVTVGEVQAATDVTAMEMATTITIDHWTVELLKKGVGDVKKNERGVQLTQTAVRHQLPLDHLTSVTDS